MDKLINVLEKKLMPIANKISSIKFLNALGKSFQLLLPIIIIGSFACLGAYIDIPAWTSFIEATGLVNIFNTLFFVTMKLIGFYLLESQSEVIDNITGCNVFFSRLPNSYVSGNSVEVHAYDGGIFGGVFLCQ